MNDQQQLTKADRIEARIDRDTTEALTVAPGGHLDFVNMAQIMEVAKVVAIAKQAIPAHLRDNVGACLAICIQASEWRMSPFAVANKSYVVNDRMAYEAQLIAAVILMRAPLKGRLKYTYQGQDGTRRCTCTATLTDGEVVDYTTPEIGKIKVKNSPLWTSDPDQQAAYFAARSLARRHFPDVILGVYTPEEMAEETTLRDVTPAKPDIGTETPVTPQAALPAAATPTPAPAKPDVSPAPAPAEAVGTATPADGGGESVVDDPKMREMAIEDINNRCDDANISTKKVRAWAASQGLVEEERTILNKYPLAALKALQARWDEFVASLQSAE